MSEDVHDRMMREAFGGGASMFGGVREPAMGPFNTGSPLLDMFGNMAARPLFQQAGMMPGELFASQNFYDATQSRLYWENRQAAQREAASADQATYVRMMRGAATMAGREWTPDMAQAAGTLAGGMSQISPFLQAFVGPDLFDQMHGARGSAVVMSSFLHRAGQTMIDPTTGLTGISGASAGRMAADVHKRFFGDNVDLGSWRGLGAGRVGMAIDELNQRGLLDRSASLLTGDARYDEMTRDMDRAQALTSELRRSAPDVHAGLLRAAGGREAAFGRRLEDMTPEQQDRSIAVGDRAGLKDALEKIDRDMPEVGADLRQKFDVGKIVEKVKGLSGAVAGVREIFGDMGMPNAPMRELIAGLDRMTQGGLTTMSAEQMQASVRKTQALAGLSGMGAENFMAMLGRGGSLAQQLGVEQQFAVGATQGAAAFGAAFGQSGIAATPHFQARSREAMTMLDQELRLQASASGAANQLAASIRIADASYAGGSPLTGDASEFVEAVKAGRTTFKDGRSVFMEDGAFKAMMKAGGADEATVSAIVAQRDANRAETAKYDLGGLVRDGAQADDRRKFIAQAQSGAVSSLLERAGIRGDRASAIVDATSDAIARTLQAGKFVDKDGKTVSFNVRNDADRNRAIAKLTRELLEKQDVNVDAIEAAAPGAFGVAAETGFGAVHQLVSEHPGLQGYGSGLALIEVDNKDVAERKAAVMQEAAAQSLVRDAMSTLGGGNPLSRLSDALQKPPAEAGKALGAIAGGVDVAGVRKKIGEMRGMSKDQLSELGITDRGKLDAMLDDLSKAADEFGKAAAAPPGKAANLDELQAAARKLAGLDGSGPKAGGPAGDAAKAAEGAAAPKKAEGDDSGTKGVQRIVGTLEIIGQRARINARTGGSDVGAAPVASM